MSLWILLGHVTKLGQDLNEGMLHLPILYDCGQSDARWSQINIVREHHRPKCIFAGGWSRIVFYSG